MSTAHWIDLDGAENARDLGGLPTADGRTVQPGRLIRSDSLQELSEADVRHLVDDLHVRAVVDLRTGVELRAEGPGPMTRERDVDIRHLSLFPEAGATTDAAAAEDVENRADPAPYSEDEGVVLPWQSEEGAADSARRGASGVYLRYLDDRADSILAALRTIADTDGATIVHCAAGKDRTGVVVACALAEVGVTPDAIVADYARSAERIEAIYGRLAARRTYAGDLRDGDVDEHRPRASTMERVLAAVDEQYGGFPAWLRANGWTDEDAARLRHKLLD
jgi:protein tyrosine/serine phosphatase